MSKLTQLFEHILYTEQEFQLKSNELKHLSAKLESVKRNLLNTKDRKVLISGEIVIRNNQLSAESCYLVGNESQMNILSEQKRLVDIANNKLKDKLLNKEEELTANENKFIEEGSRFSSKTINNYSLIKLNEIEMKCTQLEQSIIENTILLKKLKEKESIKVDLENQGLFLREGNHVQAKEIERVKNLALVIEKSKDQLERERNQLDKKYMQYNFKELKHILEINLLKKGKKERMVIEIKNEIDRIIRINRDRDSNTTQSSTRLQLTHQHITIQQPNTPFYYSRGSKPEIYKYDAETVSWSNNPKMQKSSIEINGSEVEELVDWSDISDFEELQT